MKFYFFGLLFIVGILFGCTSFEVEVTDYPDKNYKRVLLKMYHKVVKGDMDNWEVAYRRKIKGELKYPAIITFIFYADPYHHSLDSRAFVKVDDRKFRVPLRYRKSVIERETVGGIGSTPISSTILDTKDRWKKLSGKVRITNAIEKAILETEDLEYHLYSGGKLTVLKVTEDQFLKVKEFFQAGIQVDEEPESSE